MLLTPFFIFAQMGNAIAQSSFPDVAEDNSNFSAVEFLKAKGVIQGYPDATFKPQQTVNRAEAIKIIVSAFNVEISENYDVIFSDVLKEAWFFKFVMAGHAQKIISGYADGKFKPANEINLAETLKMILTASGLQMPTNLLEDVYEDVKKDQWYAPYALYAKERNIIFADDYGELHPEQKMTRAAFAEIVYRVMIVKEKNGQSFPLHTNWLLHKSSNLPFQIKFDPSWKLIEHDDETIFFRPDKQFLQYSPTRIYPNTAFVSVSLDPNVTKLSQSQYFSNIKLVFPEAKTTNFKLDQLSAMEVLQPEKRMVDWYIFLDSEEVLAVYTEYGPGLLGYQNQKFIEAMLSTLKFQEIKGKDEKEEVLNKIFANVLVEGKGKEMVNLLGDAIIIETDAIGVGTGAVDYYYGAKFNYTLKYERSADVILDTREGKTSAF